MAESCWDARHCARDALSVQASARAILDHMGETPMMDEKLRLPTSANGNVHRYQKQISHVAERDIEQARDYHGRDQGVEQDLTLRLSTSFRCSAELQIHTGSSTDLRTDFALRFGNKRNDISILNVANDHLSATGTVVKR